MSPDDLPPLGEIVIPDDARALDRDLVAYRRELRAARRRARWAWLLRDRAPQGSQQRRRTALVVVAGTLLVALLVGTLAAMVPSFVRSGGRRAPEPLGNPAQAVGKVGGLLPVTTLVPVTGTDRRPLPVRDLRPAALVLVPRGCGCAPVVDEVLSAAATVALRVAVVAPGSVDDPELPMLTGRAGGPTGDAFLDPTSALTTAYPAATAPALVVADAAGIVRTILPSLRDDQATRAALRADLDALVRIG